MRIFYCLLLGFIWLPAFSLENIFYVLHDDYKNAISAIEKNHSVVNKLIVQAYQIDQKGTLSGTIDPEVLLIAKTYSIPIYAMVTNAGFNVAATHQFLNDTTAQTKALDQLIIQCKKDGVYGVQFDFEMIRLKNRDNLTTFYTKAATQLHAAGYRVSFAVAPVIEDKNFKTYYQKKLYEVWQGAYDLAKLAPISDFITIMAYDQHALNTTPGAIASIPWDMDVITYALQFIPAEKISLGIPTYSGLWYMGMSGSGSVNIRYDSADYKTVQYILKKYHLFLHWDYVNQVNYSFYDANGVNKYLFIENAKSFQAKYDLAKKFKLGSVSIFRLGIEDPDIWNILQSQKN
ncbi:MAG TPA: glycosyl hydrolase family 18 protein [Gammaproteobacteria bacterium]|jgi:spore germination protein YaaH|nr:glycosyl hydrolase family 18 protein [Gammaproteobacteria bacterium]